MWNRRTRLVTSPRPTISTTSAISQPSWNGPTCCRIYYIRPRKKRPKCAPQTILLSIVGKVNMPTTSHKAERPIPSLYPTSKASPNIQELAVNIVFGIVAAAVALLTLWQAHRLWRAMRQTAGQAREGTTTLVALNVLMPLLIRMHSGWKHYLHGARHPSYHAVEHRTQFVSASTIFTINTCMLMLRPAVGLPPSTSMEHTTMNQH